MNQSEKAKYFVLIPILGAIILLSNFAHSCACGCFHEPTTFPTKLLVNLNLGGAERYVKKYYPQYEIHEDEKSIEILTSVIAEDCLYTLAKIKLNRGPNKNYRFLKKIVLLSVASGSNFSQPVLNGNTSYNWVHRIAAYQFNIKSSPRLVGLRYRRLDRTSRLVVLAIYSGKIITITKSGPLKVHVCSTQYVNN